MWFLSFFLNATTQMYFVHLIHPLPLKKPWFREDRSIAENLNANQFSTSMLFCFYGMPKADLQVGSEYQGNMSTSEFLPISHHPQAP